MRRFQFTGDAQGVLQAVIHQRAKDPVHELIGGIAVDITACHFWSEGNLACDALSRKFDGVVLPDVLRSSKVVPPVCEHPWPLLSDSCMQIGAGSDLTSGEGREVT